MLRVISKPCSYGSLKVINSSIYDDDTYDGSVSAPVDAECVLSGAASGTVARVDIVVDLSCSSLCSANQGESPP